MGTKQKNKVKRRKVLSAMIRIEKRLQKGKASKYIDHAEISLKSRDNVIVICRVSSRFQNSKKKQNNDDQENYLRNFCESKGAIVIGVIKYVGSGFDPVWLGQASAKAQKKGCKLLAESTDRFIRHQMFHSKNQPQLQANTEDLEDLRFYTSGVPLLTVLHPDSSPSEVRRHQTKRGQTQKGKKGGRPKSIKKAEDKKPGWTRRRKRKQLRMVLNLHSESFSMRGIEAITGIPKSTVTRWIKRHF